MGTQHTNPPAYQGDLRKAIELLQATQIPNAQHIAREMAKSILPAVEQLKCNVAQMFPNFQPPPILLPPLFPTISISPGIQHTAQAVEEILRQLREITAECDQYRSLLASKDEQRVLADSDKSQLQTALEKARQRISELEKMLRSKPVDGSGTKPYIWKRHSLPFQSPEGPFQTDLPDEDEESEI